MKNSYYCYTAEALCGVLVKGWNAETGYITGMVRARSQTEALNNAMTEIMDNMHISEGWSSEEMAATWSTTYGSITIVETETGKIINHIQRLSVHEC